jgi:trimeric autotransporter adhesin
VTLAATGRPYVWARPPYDAGRKAVRPARMKISRARLGGASDAPLMSELSTVGAGGGGASVVAPVVRGPRRLSWRSLAWLVALISALGVVVGILEGPNTSSRAEGQATSWSSIPLMARGPVSAALGADNAAYRLGESAGGRWRAVNATQSLSATFGRSGMLVSSDGSRLGLRLASVGFGGSLEPVGEVAPVGHDNRLVYTHPGLSESYANGPLGLEQGFTVARPRVAGTSKLVLSMALSSDLRPSLTDGGVLFDRAGRAMLADRDLVVTDARGRRLRSWFAVSGDRLNIEVDTVRAAYPVRIDPLLQQATLSATDVTAGSYVGESVAVSGDGSTVVVGATGANSGDGAVYVFSEPAGGWASGTQTATLTASSGTSGDEFGASVAVSSDGSTVVVGAPETTVGSNADQGTAYVFSEPAEGWASDTQTSTLEESSGASNDKFGNSVSVSGNGSTVVAGAAYATVTTNSAGRGAVYVFSEPGGGWTSTTPLTQTATLTTSNSGNIVYLGSAVAISSDGSTVVAGAASATVGSGSGQGEVFIFDEPGGGWASQTQTSRLTASTGVSGDGLGWSVAVSGNGSTVVSGALYAPDSGGATGPGAAYVFSEPAQGWPSEPTGTQTATLTASNTAVGDFGESVAVSSAAGSTVVVGSPFQGFGGSTEQEGAAYVFSEPTGGWASETQTSELSASNGVTFGWSVAASADGSSVIASALGTAVGTTEGAGAAFVFGSSSATGTTTTSTNTTPTPAPTSTPSTGVTPSPTTTAPKASPAIPAVGHVTISGTSATVPLSCSGPTGSSCAVKLSLSVTETVEGSKVIAIAAREASDSKKKTKTTKKTVALGATKVTVLAGHRRQVEISLNAQGKRLLAESHKLTVKLVVSKVQGSSTDSFRTAALTFRATAHTKK